MARPSQLVHVSIDDSPMKPTSQSGGRAIRATSPIRRTDAILALHVPPGVSNVRVYGSATQTQDVWQTRPSTWGPNVLHCELFARATNRQLPGSMLSSRPLRTAQTTNSCLVSIPSLFWIPYMAFRIVSG